MLPQEFNLMNFYTGTSSAGSDMFASLILFFFTRKRFVSSWNLHHLNLDHVKLNRLCIDCVLGRKNTNGTFASLTVSKSLQNVFKIDVIAIWRCRGKKIKETMVFFDSAVYFRTKTEEVMTLQWCAQKYSFVNKGFFSCDFFLCSFVYLGNSNLWT